MTPSTAFALACALHAGFQVTVTALVYPALGSRSSGDWAPAHHRHSRVIAPVVAVVYGALVVTGALLVADSPSPAGWAALAATVGAVGVTALAAAPLHGRLATRDDDLVRRLLLVDRWRCALAILGAVLATVAVSIG